MIHKTKGIVIRSIKYRDSGLIVHIFTEKFGIQHYLIQGATRPKARLKAHLFQNLQLLDLQVYHKNKGQLERIKEASPSHLTHNISTNIAKSSIALFLNEILYKVLKNQNTDSSIFDFIYNSLLWLDSTEERCNDFHLVFLIKLSKLLGFGPISSEQPQYFDLILGVFMSYIPPHPQILSSPLSEHFNTLISTNYENVHHIKLTKPERNLLLEKIIEFYQIHVDGFGQVNSLDVLKDIFN